MNINKFERINNDSVLNQDDILRRKVNGKYEYYKIKEYDDLKEKYFLESLTNLPESLGFQVYAPTNELINHFEKSQNE